MNLKKFTSSLLLTCFFHQAVSTAAFAMSQDFEGVERYAQGLATDHRTSLHFKADAAHTAAGVLFYKLDPDGNYSVILGQRDDDPGFCNFGGKSDADDGTLNITAARESAEESMGLFAVHGYLVSRAPFADVYSSGTSASGDKSKLYRMYLYQTEYIAESRFDKKLAEATDSHSKEYKRFKTFKVRDLLDAVTNKTKDVKTSDQEEVTLYGPLFNMLSTPFYRDALNRLANNQRTPLSAPQKASYIREEDYTNHDDGKVSTRDKLAYDFEAIAIAATERANSNATEAAEELKLIKKLKNFGHNLDGMKIVPNAYEKVQFTAQEEKEFAYTEAFRQRVMMELKSNAEKKRIAALESPVFLEKTKKFDVYSVRPKVDVSPGRYTMTEGHLMLVLGHDYVEPTDFLDLSLHRQANIANLKRYFAKYNSMEFENKVATEGVDEEGKKAEFKRKLIVDDRFIERLADVMDVERQEWVKTGRFPVYHGTTDQNGHAFRIASIINNHLTLNATDHLTRLRYTDLYFREVANMAEDIARYGTDHYENGNRDRRLFGNFVLTAGRATSRSTSSTVEYWGNNHSVADPNVKKRFEEGTALLGMDLAYAYYESLFQQFIADTGTAYGNALLLQMFISPEALTGYGATDYMNEKVALTAYQNAQAEYKRIGQSGKEDFEPKKTDGTIDSARTPETEKKKGLFGEVRLQLHPDMMRDPSQFTAYGLDFFPLDTAKQRRFNNGLSAVTAANLGHWFSQKTALIPGSLMETPTARNLYKMVYKSVTGDDMDDVPNTHSLLHLARFGHLEALETLIKACPDLVGSINPIQLFDAALASGSYTVTKYVVTEIIKRPIHEILDIKSVLTKMEMETQQKFKSSFNYILKHYDFARIPESDMPAEVKKTLARIVLRTGNDYAIELVQRKIRPYTDEDIVEVFMQNDCNPDDWESGAVAIIHRGLVTIEKFTSLLLSYMKSAPASEQWFPQNQFIKLLKRGLHVSAINPNTGDPFLFDVPFFNNLAPEEGTFLYQGDFLSVRNQHGLNVLEHVLIEYKKGKKTSHQFTAAVDALIKRTSGSLKSYVSPELYEFFKHKIESNNVSWLVHNNPFVQPEAQAWIAQIESALQSDHYPAIKQVTEECPSDELLSYYVKASPEKILTQHQQQLRTRLYQEENDWRVAMDKALSGEDMEVVSQLIETMPLKAYYHEVYKDVGATRYWDINTKINEKIASLPEKKRLLLEAWEVRLNEALDSEQYSRIMDVLSEVPNPDYTLTDERLKISNKRYALKQQLEAEFKADPHAFMAKVDTIDFSVFDSRTLDGFFKDEFAPYTKDILNQLFKDVPLEKRAEVVLKPISDNGDTTPFIMKTIFCMPAHLKVTRAIFEWAGCSLVLKGMTENQMVSLFLRVQESEPSLFDFIFEHARDVLSSAEPGKDFLRESLDFMPNKYVSVLVRDNIPALKEPGADGFPRFFQLFGSHEKLLMELIKENPLLLDFKTSMGLSLEDLVAHANEDEQMTQILKKLLKMKQTLVRDGNML